MSPSDYRLLVVEDDPVSREVITDILKDRGYDIREAESGADGLQLVKDFKPHLVISDYDMPGMTGLEMLRGLRSQQNYVTLIFVSGRADTSAVVQCLRDGADDFIKKPFRMEEFAARIEVALRTNEIHRELHEANQKLQDMVDTDHLTGLHNMRTIYEKIDYELRRSQRTGQKATCVMIDLDHFKSVNDNNDHLFGSYVLQEFGHMIQKNIRDVDLAARYGGDEFLVCLVDTDGKGAECFCERLRAIMETHVFKKEDSEIQLTISLGFAVSSGDPEEDAISLVRRADHSLYKSKELGRNRFSGDSE
ncbi:MAG: diguanylate cyclase response regulator [Bdellovibrionaceae bacterium]|nr:diguanylate cyclase response regulator [Pseudobdellovibrionaceae bacterium]